MTSIADRYRRVSSRFTDLVEAVPADRWDSPSPCEEWTAKDILAHVVSTEVELLGRMPFAPTDSALGATEDIGPLQAWPIVREHVQSALDDPANADHAYDGYFGPTTFAKTVDQFYSLDLVVHAWDLARATDLAEFEKMPPDEIETVTNALGPIADTMRQPGVFGPEVPVADDADPQTKLLGIVGRRA